ncbi:alcohol dehydrogenase AdhP [Acidiferrimicrobium sp. IK]|uniref:alcohol dehydrogenase AdhP n=1 Tax=Acidiferrimicrobium sp. IK TaxID=2871700 RepID=UPI0021CB5200|nr:alcohol dehydrogenase AdhP [Acidiferrimicrobium sp. IK]MCU4185867.1 alcohol dehydrogenase AdhP [Acidiferrimicrobium sp. IK]
MKAAVVHQFDQPFTLEDIPTPSPGHGQVLVKVETSGLCHTDIHAARGDWPVKPTLPFVPGHEGVGIVAGVGPGVTNLQEGDRVAVPWLGWACGACELCASGWETLCPSARYTGYSVDGGFAEYVLAEAAFAGKVPPQIDPLDAAPLTCAGVTTYKAVKVSGARSSDLVAIYGVGGLGHLALQYAQIAGATVAAVDVVDAKLDMAKRLGASYTINGSVDDAPEVIQGLGGADAAIVLAPSPAAFEQAFASLRPNGTLVMVGLPKSNTMHLPIFETVLRGIKVVGSLVGTRVDLAETFGLHADGRTTIVRESRQLEQVNDAITQVEAGEVEARLVFDLR